MDPADSGKFFFFFNLSLNCLKEFLIEGLCQKRANTRENLLYQKHLTAWHGKNLFSKYVFFSFSCTLSSSPWVPQTLTLLLSSRGHINLYCLSVFEPFTFGGFRTYVITFVFLLLMSYVNLLIRPDKECRQEDGESFLSLHQPSYYKR